MSGQSLKQGALGFLGALVMSVAGAAPSYSITASTAALVAAVGIAGPAALWIAFVPMMGITIAFSYLNKWRSDAGAAYAWVSRAVSPELGFLIGWAFLSLSTIFMVAAALPAGEATLDLIAPRDIHDVSIATGVGVLWYLGVLTLVTLGITATVSVQILLTTLELCALILVGTLAIWNSYAAPVTQFSLSWFMPSSFSSFEAFSAGMLVAIFYFFGWDVSSNLSEETVDAKKTSGLGGIIGVLIVFALFLLIQIAMQMSLAPDVIQANSANLLPELGHIALPGYWGAIAAFAVMISVVGTLETQLLQCTRLLFSMARDGVISEKMGNLHPRFKTPWLAGFAVSAVALLLFAASTIAPTINQLMCDLIDAIGIQISFYYSIAAFTCVWYYRKIMLSDWRILAFAGIVPFASAIFVACVGIYQLFELGWRVSIISIGTILIGIIPMLYYRRLYKSNFYSDAIECANKAI